MKRALKISVALSSASLLLGSQILLPPSPVKAQIPIGSAGCPAGTSDRFSPNIVQNPTFANGNVGFTTSPSLIYRGINQYGEGYSIVNNSGAFAATAPGVIIPQRFPGDPQRGVALSESYYYSNPSNNDYQVNAGAPTLWQQDVTVQPSTAYNFLVYLRNVLQPGPGDPQANDTPDANGYPPVIDLGVSDGVAPPVPLTPPTRVRTIPTQPNIQGWVPIQVSFVTGPAQTTARLTIVDAAGLAFGLNANGTYNAVTGDDFSFTAIGLRRCLPNIGVAKQAGTPTRNQNGSYTVPYTVRVTNLASVAGAQYTLSDLRLQENLANTFTGATFNGINTVQSPTLSLNPNFNGSTDTELLQSPSTLQPGETATVTFNAVVTPGTGPNGFGPFNNQVRATALAQDGTQVNDDSTDGANVDPDGNGTPDENTPTPVTLPQNPQVGIAKQAGTPVANGDGSFTVPYTLIIRNSGATILNNVQVVEDLSQTFAQASSFSVVPNSVAGTGVTIDPAFNGTTSNANLLAAGNTLALNQSATINFSVRVVPGSNLGPYNNTATVSGTSPNGTRVSDVSQNGANSDPDGNGNPGDNNTPTPVDFGSSGAAGFRLVKRITRVVPNGGAPSNFTAFVDGPGDDDNAPGFAQLRPQGAPVGVITTDANAPLRSGDEVEYTIYFLSDGTTPAFNVNLCDPIPTGTGFVTDTSQVQRNNAAIASGGTFFSPLAPLPAGNSCPNQGNANGALIFNLGDVLSVQGNNFGLVRFRVRIN